MPLSIQPLLRSSSPSSRTTRRVDPWIHDVVHRMSGPRHHSKSTGPEMLQSIMRSTALCVV